MPGLQEHQLQLSCIEQQFTVPTPTPLQDSGSELVRSSLLTKMRNIDKVPASLRQGFIDNAGGSVDGPAGIHYLLHPCCLHDLPPAGMLTTTCSGQSCADLRQALRVGPPGISWTASTGHLALWINSRRDLLPLLSVCLARVMPGFWRMSRGF